MLFNACQRKSIPFAAVLAGAVVFFWTSAEAQLVASQAYSSRVYQLSLGDADPFRLAAGKDLMPASPERNKESTKLSELPFAAQIDNAARSASLDPVLVHALIHVESRHNPAARSPKGALGLMQVLPETASRYGIDDAIRSVDANLRAGTRYLRDLMALFDGRIELVLAAYNAGENAVLRHGQRIPPFRETQLYVPAVLAKYREWQDPPPAEAHSIGRVVYMPGTRLNLSAQSQLRPSEGSWR